MKKPEPKWFVRVTSVDKANGPIHNMVTTHGTYSQASVHLTNVIGAERAAEPMKHYTKGKLHFEILPMKKTKEPPKLKKDTRTESLMEDTDKDEVKPRDKNQIVKDASDRAKKKVGLEKDKVVDKAKTGNKTAVGGTANKIDDDPELHNTLNQGTERPIIQPSPSNVGSA
jgi:hypothetical protein